MVGRAARRDVGLQAIAQDRRSHLILLLLDDMAEGGREELDVFELGVLGRKRHGPAGVERERADEVGFVLVELEVGPAAAGKGLPIEVPEVIALDILAVVGEFAGAAEPARPMPAREGAFDSLPRGETQTRQRRERGKIQEAAAGRLGRRDHAATRCSRCATMAGAATPSPTARWFAITRWRKMGRATARMSS